MASETLKKCAHPPCECLVEAGEKFCGSACANEPASAPKSSCFCGHVGCAEGRRLAEQGKFRALTAHGTR